MKEYTVIWTIDVLADSYEGAAKFAQEVMSDPSSTATFFKVKEIDTQRFKTVDLLTETVREHGTSNKANKV